MHDVPETITSTRRKAPRRWRLRERIGWTILFVVVTLSRLAVWVDAAIAEPDPSTEQRR